MSKTNKTIKRLTINISPKNYELLAQLANDQDRSLSWLAGRAIEEYLEKEENKQTSKTA